MRSISHIVAVDAIGGIGKSGQLPWPTNKRDLARFKEITTGHTVIMGRATFDEIYSRLGTPLPDRTNIVLTTSTIDVPGVTTVQSLTAALDLCSTDNEVFVIGGERLFVESFPFVDTIYLTQLSNTYDCDCFYNISYVASHFSIVDGDNSDPSSIFLTLKRHR